MAEQKPQQIAEKRMRRVKRRTRLPGTAAPVEGLSRRTQLIIAAVLLGLLAVLAAVYFVLGRSSTPAVTPAAAPVVANAEQRANADVWAWQLAQEQGSAEALGSYLKLFPEGQFAEKARALLAQLNEPAEGDAAVDAGASSVKQSRDASIDTERLQPSARSAANSRSETAQKPRAKKPVKAAVSPQPASARPFSTELPKPDWRGVEGPKDWRQAVFQHRYGPASAPEPTPKTQSQVSVVSQAQPSVKKDTALEPVLRPAVAAGERALVIKLGDATSMGELAHAVAGKAPIAIGDVAATSDKSGATLKAQPSKPVITQAELAKALARPQSESQAQPQSQPRGEQGVASDTASSQSQAQQQSTPLNKAEVVLPAETSLPPATGVVQQRLRLPGGDMAFAIIPAGEFLMGSELDAAIERPVRKVSVKRFALARAELSFAQFDAFVEATGYRRPDDGGWGRGEQPVVDVSWEDVQAYIAWLNKTLGGGFRLPSEAEWEYALRAGGNSRFSVGNCLGYEQANFSVSSDLKGCQNPAGSAVERPLPPGRYAANPWGLFDMHGNVWEWVADCWHRDYRSAPSTAEPWLEAAGGKCNARVIRGGSWRSALTYLRSSSRYVEPNYRRNDSLGFRLARDLEVE